VAGGRAGHRRCCERAVVPSGGGMIVYHPKKWRGFSVLCGRHCLRGSVFLLSLPYGMVAGMIALLVKLDEVHRWGIFNGEFGHTVREDSFFDHPYSLQIWATSLGFLLVFRGNLAYARYWEGRMQLARMCSYYQDAATVRRLAPAAGCYRCLGSRCAVMTPASWRRTPCALMRPTRMSISTASGSR
jgi:hypothetical protein